MTESIISKCELTDYLEKLRKIVCNLELSSAKNVIFINTVSFYIFVDKFFNKTNISFENIMTKIEPFIPLTLCIDEISFNILIQAKCTTDLKEFKKLETLFFKKANIDFIKTIKNIKTEEEWNNILKMCYTLYEAQI